MGRLRFDLDPFIMEVIFKYGSTNLIMAMAALVRGYIPLYSFFFLSLACLLIESIYSSYFWCWPWKLIVNIIFLYSLSLLLLHVHTYALLLPFSLWSLTSFCDLTISRHPIFNLCHRFPIIILQKMRGTSWHTGTCLEMVSFGGAACKCWFLQIYKDVQ